MALPKKTKQPAGSGAAGAPASEAELHVEDKPVAGHAGQPTGAAVAAAKASVGEFLELASVEFDHPVPFNRTESSCRLRNIDVVLEERGDFIYVYGQAFACKVPISRVLHVVYVNK